MVTIETITQGTVPVSDSDGFWAMNMIGAAEQYAPIEYKTESLRQIFTTATVIWIIIAIAALMTAMALYILTRKELRKAIHIKDNLYCSDMLLSPVLIGLIQPKIILPEFLDPNSAECKMVLAHEDTHRKRADNLWRLLGTCITQSSRMGHVAVLAGSRSGADYKSAVAGVTLCPGTKAGVYIWIPLPYLFMNISALTTALWHERPGRYP